MPQGCICHSFQLALNLSNDDAFWLQGFGPMAVNIFAREAQAAWEELFPFADERTLGMAKDHGLPGSAEELASLVDNDRHKFVRLLAGEQGCYCSALLCKLYKVAGCSFA